MANGSPNNLTGNLTGKPTGRLRTSGVFSGLLLIIFGFLLLFHNYGHLEIGNLIHHWWPLIFIFWGGTKLYERTMAQRQGRSACWITPGEVFMVNGIMTVVVHGIAADNIPHAN